MSEQIKIRAGKRSDLALILSLIKDLAEFEKLSHEVVATEESIAKTLFGDSAKAEVLIAEIKADRGTKAIGFALFFHNYSTFLGRSGIYLEDLYVKPEFRGQGFGKQLLQKLAAIAVERNCGRLEWSVLDWNQKAIDFYESLGAKALQEWITYRLTGPELKQLGTELSHAE